MKMFRFVDQTGTEAYVDLEQVRVIIIASPLNANQTAAQIICAGTAVNCTPDIAHRVVEELRKMDVIMNPDTGIIRGDNQALVDVQRKFGPGQN